MEPEVLPIHSEQDIVLVRRAVRQNAIDAHFNVVDQTKLITAASELARNTLVYGKGGRAKLERIAANGRTAIRLTFEDQGPGISNIEKALEDGYTTGGGLGLGLSGAKRLVNEFEIESEVDKGTRIVITKWRAS